MADPISPAFCLPEFQQAWQQLSGNARGIIWVLAATLSRSVAGTCHKVVAVYAPEAQMLVFLRAMVTLNNDMRRVSVGDTTSIPTGSVHRIENDGTDDLIIIETQLGVCLEDDIMRLEDDWGRA